MKKRKYLVYVILVDNLNDLLHYDHKLHFMVKIQGTEVKNTRYRRCMAKYPIHCLAIA